MYEQISSSTPYLMFYAGVTVLNVIACLYLLFRRANAIAPDITSPVRLRRWTAAFFAASALSHLWYLPSYFLTSGDDASLCFLLGGLLDCLTVFPLLIVILFVMLQDRRRPLWPAAVMVAPLVVGVVLCISSRSLAFLPMLYVYLILLSIGLIIYMVCALRQYRSWLRDNYADLEHKEVWQSLTVLGIFLLLFSIYAISAKALVYEYILQAYGMMLTCFLVWRVETLNDLSITQSQNILSDVDIPDKYESNVSKKNFIDNIGLLLQRHCVNTELYLQHDLTLSQLAKAIGTNRSYLGQYFHTQGINYNTYINNLRINHFVSIYREAVAAHRSFTIQKLAYDCGYHSYSTFILAFKQRMGQTITAWARLQNLQ